jgi:hypothetical protein
VRGAAAGEPNLGSETARSAPSRAQIPRKREARRRNSILGEVSPGVRGRLGFGAVQRPRDDQRPREGGGPKGRSPLVGGPLRSSRCPVGEVVRRTTRRANGLGGGLERCRHARRPLLGGVNSLLPECTKVTRISFHLASPPPDGPPTENGPYDQPNHRGFSPFASSKPSPIRVRVHRAAGGAPAAEIRGRAIRGTRDGVDHPGSSPGGAGAPRTTPGQCRSAVSTRGFRANRLGRGRRPGAVARRAPLKALRFRP